MSAESDILIFHTPHSVTSHFLTQTHFTVNSSGFSAAPLGKCLLNEQVTTVLLLVHQVAHLVSVGTILSSMV